MFHNIRLIVFDLDGTLVDAFPDITAAANHALGLLRRAERSLSEVTRYVGHGGRNLMKSLLGDGASEDEVDRAFEAWRIYYAEHPTDRAQVYPGVREALSTLRERGVKLALVSNKLHELTCAIAENMGIAPYFDAIQGEKPDVPRKPDPAALQRLMDLFGVAREETLMVGDGDADMNLGRNAGVATVAMGYGVCPVERLRELGAAVVLDTMADLPRLLD